MDSTIAGSVVISTIKTDYHNITEIFLKIKKSTHNSNTNQWNLYFEMYFVGVAIGMGLCGMSEIYTTKESMSHKGYKGVNPYFLPKILINMAAGNVSVRYGLKVSILLKEKSIRSVKV